MKGYFARKPENIEIAKGIIEEAQRAGFKPVEITPIAVIRLDADRYAAFCEDTLQYWDFLEPYAEQSTFTGDHTANCVIVESEGQQPIAVCLEGYCYPRYTALVLENEKKAESMKPTVSPGEKHILPLENCGAQIRRSDGSTEPLNMAFYHRAVSLCAKGGFNAVTYDLVLPGADGEFVIAFWRNGDVDSGSSYRITGCLTR